jgi:hypothetical protein
MGHARGSFRGLGFNPGQLSKISAWLRLAASSQSAGEWTSITDVINSNPATSNAARRAAVGSSANALPIATFATNDCWSWPLNASNNGTTHWGIGFWMRPASVGTGSLVLASICDGTAGASLKKVLLEQHFNALRFSAFSSGSNGRSLTISAALSASVWTWVRADWTSSRTGDDKLRVYVGGAQASGSYADVLAGPIPTDLLAPTGNALLGNFNDGVAAGPYAGDLGPNLYSTGVDLTTAEDVALMNFERPT